MALASQLWRDERAFIVTIELILIATITVLGLIVGLTAPVSYTHLTLPTIYSV